MIPRRFKFSLTQLLLLTAFVGLLAGLLAASRREATQRHLLSPTFSPDGRFLAADFATGGVQVWDLSKNKAPSRKLSLPVTPYYHVPDRSLRFLTPTTIVAVRPQYTPAPRKQIIHWDVAENRLVKSVDIATTAYPIVRVSGGGRNAVLATYGGTTQTVDLWDLDTGQQAGTITTAGQPGFVAVDPDTNRITVTFAAVRGTGVCVETWDAQSKTRIRTQSFSPKYEMLAVSDDGKWLALSHVSDLNCAEVWNLFSGQREARITNISTPDIYTSRFSPDGRLLAASNYDGRMQVWDVRSGRLRGELDLPFGFIQDHLRDFVFSPDGQTLAVGDNGRVLLWDMKTLGTRTLTRSRAVETIVLFSTGLFVWAIVWGVVVRRQRKRSSAEPPPLHEPAWKPSPAAKPRAPFKSDKLPPPIAGALHPYRTLLQVFAILVVFSAVVAIVLMWPVRSYSGWGHVSSYAVAFVATLIGLPLLLIYGGRARRWYLRRTGRPFADALKGARQAAGHDGRIVKFGTVTACFFGDSQIEPIVTQTYQAALKRFWDILGEPYVPQHPLLILVFDQPSDLDAYLKGHLPLDGVYSAFGERQILICEQTTLDYLGEPRRALRRLLAHYFLHDYRGALLPPCVQMLVAHACDDHPPDLPRLHRALRARLRREAESTDKDLFSTTSREFFELYFDSDSLSNYRRMTYLAKQAASMASYLTDATADNAGERFRRFVSDVPRKGDYEEVFERHFGCGFAQLLENWRDWSLSQEIEPINPLPDILERHLTDRLVPLIQSEEAPVAEQIRAVRSIGSSVCLSAAGVLIDILRAGPSHPLYDEAAASLETVSGESFGNDADRWQAWWDTQPKRTENTADVPAPVAGPATCVDEEIATVTAELVNAPDAAASPADPPAATKGDTTKAHGAAVDSDPSHWHIPSETGLLRASQLLIGIAAVVAIVWSAAFVMLGPAAIMSEFFFAAMQLYGALAGVYAITRLAAGDHDGLKRATTLLISCFISCNLISTLLAVAARGLLNHREFRQRLETTIRKAG